MHIKVTLPENPTPTLAYTVDELLNGKAPEGVYRCVTHPDVRERIVVFKHVNNPEVAPPAVLYVSPMRVEPLNRDCWEEATFVETNEDIALVVGKDSSDCDKVSDPDDF